VRAQARRRPFQRRQAVEIGLDGIIGPVADRIVTVAQSGGHHNPEAA